MAHSAIMSVRITGNADDAVKAFEKTTTKAAAFGSAIGGLAVKGVTALWDTVKGFAGDVVNMSDSTDKFMNTMSFAGIDTKAVQAAAKETRKYADDTVYGLDDIQNTTAQLAANGIGNYMELTEAAGNLNAVAGGNADSFKSVAMMLTQTAGAGKLTTENWNQLADAIPGASGKLQEALLKNGAYTGNFRDAMSKGEITADEFNKALADYTATVGEKYKGLKGVPMVFAVGDGNHSLATAKACYEEQKKGKTPEEYLALPARYALVEVVNNHDDALQFEPIHRVLFGVDHQKFMDAFRAAYPNAYEGKGDGHTIEFVWNGESHFITVPDPKVQLAVGTLQGVIDQYLKDNGGEVDYIHGDDVTRELGSKPGNMGFLLPAMGKEQLFKTVMADGVLPRKTFSMGHAQDKRYYIEARKIVK